MADKDMRKIAKLVGQTVSKAVAPLNKQLAGINKSISGINEQLSGINGQLSIIEEKLDSATVDIHQLQEDVKGLYSYIDEIKDKQERRFKEIREELDLQTS